MFIISSTKTEKNLLIYEKYQTNQIITHFKLYFSLAFYPLGFYKHIWHSTFDRNSAYATNDHNELSDLLHLKRDPNISQKKLGNRDEFREFWHPLIPCVPLSVIPASASLWL